MPKTPTGTLTQKTARQSQTASSPPATNPMNWPLNPATWLIPSARPRWSWGKASVRMAAEFAISIEPPMAWRKRQPISQSAPLLPRNGSMESSTDATVNTAKPAL